MEKQTLKYYSQFGEDYLLWEFFEHKLEGFFVDIGAFDGVHLSNSYSFELQGWNGICVEPHPVYFDYCRNSRPNSYCVNAACVGDETKQHVEFLSEEMGLLSGIGFNREADVRQRYAKRGLNFEGFKKVEIPAVTIDNLLAAYLPESVAIDFISIDVEGTETDVLDGLDLNLYQPRVLIIETNTPDFKQVIDRYLSQAGGYMCARSLAVNTFYVRDPADIEQMNRIRVKCRIEPQQHPLGKAYTIPVFMNGKEINES